MHPQARRVFRLSLIVALSLVFSYTLPMALPFLAPVLALMLSATPAPPLRLKALVGLSLLALLTTGLGVVLIPLLLEYGATALLLVALGLFLSHYVTVARGKVLVGALLAMGVAMISAAGTVSDRLAFVVIQDLLLSIALAVLCQWLVDPWFPEEEQAVPPPEEQPRDAADAKWIALRGTLIVFPAYLLVLTNPLQYLPVIMKAVGLAQQGSSLDARHAGRELLGSTLLAGVLAVLLWSLLRIQPTLWSFFWLVLLLMVWAAARLYQVRPNRFPPSFWLNTVVTMLLLVGPAVQDSAEGKDVMTAFVTRMGLFIAVTLYAWLAIDLLEAWRGRGLRRDDGTPATPEIA